MLKIDLCGLWKLTGFEENKEIPAKVPGSVMASLLENQLIKDPYYRENEYEVRDLFYNDYTYSRRFNVPADLLNQDVIQLACQGLDTIADIYVNGRFLGHAENMHVFWRFDLHGYLVAGENSIEIRFSSPMKYIKDAWERDGHISYVATGNVPGTSFLRKAHCMYGWDWGPQLPDAGIWRDIAIEAFDHPRIEDIHVIQHHEQGSVRIEGGIDVNCIGKGIISTDILLSDPQGNDIKKVTAEVSGKHVSFELSVENPQLWWPNNFGEQPLYTLTVSLIYQDRTVEQKTMRLGLRTLRLSREKDKWGQEFCFKVNGVKIFSMGADYIPEDNIFSRINPERTRKLLQDCVDSNFNTIRIWGGGYYPDSYLFDICDELGLIVWMDLMYACNIYRLTDSFEQSIVLETEQNLKRLRHHASLGLICGNNEMEWAWCNWPKVTIHDEYLKADYIKQFEYVLKGVCSRVAPEVEFWPSSPSSGGCFDNPNDPNRGDVHYWDVWHGMKPFTDYRNYYFRYCSEFGFESFPSMKTIKTFTEEQDLNIFSRVMESHQKCATGNGKILWYASENYRYPRNLSMMVYTSQLLQSEAVRYGVEHWRRNRGRCMGAIYWQLNDCWPVASWASIDYYGRWKALHYSSRRFFAPLMISALERGTKVSLFVINETMQSFNGSIVWNLRDNSGRILKTGTATASVPSLTSQDIVDLDFELDMESGILHPEDRVMLDYRLYTSETQISEGSVLFTQPKHFEFLDPVITYELSETAEGFILVLSAKNFAKAVCLELSDADCRFSDNWFDLYPDEKRSIVIKKENLSKLLCMDEIKKQLTITSIFDI